MKFFAFLAAIGFAGAVQAQELDVHFSCGVNGDQHGLKTLFADNGRIRIHSTTIAEFSWESSVFHAGNGVECSMDRDDGLHAEFIGDDNRPAWRILLDNPGQARDRRGYDMSHGLNCTVRIEHIGDEIHINPSCPALCGSRQNFSEFRFNTKTGKCTYEE
ncbi:MAG TPA: hypothetical protein VF798_11315 [Burkholderiaceae bacterium]